MCVVTRASMQHLFAILLTFTVLFSPLLNRMNTKLDSIFRLAKTFQLLDDFLLNCVTLIDNRPHIIRVSLVRKPLGIETMAI